MLRTNDKRMAGGHPLDFFTGTPALPAGISTILSFFHHVSQEKFPDMV